MSMFYKHCQASFISTSSDLCSSVRSVHVQWQDFKQLIIRLYLLSMTQSMFRFKKSLVNLKDTKSHAFRVRPMRDTHAFRPTLTLTRNEISRTGVNVLHVLEIFTQFSI